MPRQRVGTEKFADHLSQAIEAFAQVGMPGAQKNANRQGKAQHGDASSKTARRLRRVVASKSGGTRITRPDPSTISRFGFRVEVGATRIGTNAGKSSPRAFGP